MTKIEMIRLVNEKAASYSASAVRAQHQAYFADTPEQASRLAAKADILTAQAEALASVALELEDALDDSDIIAAIEGGAEK